MASVLRRAIPKRVNHRLPLVVLHLVDAMSADDHLWGKERVVRMLMLEQRACGTIAPQLLAFSPCRLVKELQVEQFNARHLGGVSVISAVDRIARQIADERITTLHSHGYKANIVARLLRITGKAPGVRIVSTCHGFVDSTLRLRFYNQLDRWTSMWSDVTTVPDPHMLASFPGFARTAAIANGLPDAPDIMNVERDPNVFRVGTLGRISEEKGALEFLFAAAQCPKKSIQFVLAGAGTSREMGTQAPNVRYAGYQEDAHAYLHSLDVYVQASRSEGLSLALLEAMRAGKAIVATDVGATREAVRDGESALIVPPKAPQALLDAILRLEQDSDLAYRLGQSARKRFAKEFRLHRQHDRFYHYYLRGDAK